MKPREPRSVGYLDNDYFYILVTILVYCKLLSFSAMVLLKNIIVS